MIQKDDYYPFGLTFNSWRNTLNNHYFYNQGTGDVKFAVERQSELSVDFTKRRVYDYALGRFWQVDPLADELNQELLSPYHYSFNNPIRYNDPYGENGWDKVLGFAAAVENKASAGLIPARTIAANYVSEDGAADFNQGQDAGDITSIVVGAAMIEGGMGGAAGGLVVSATGVGAVVGVPTVAASTALIAQGAVLSVSGALNLGAQKERLNVEETIRPEAGYLKGKKHVIKWEEGPARAQKDQKPQGQWGSKKDLDFASEKAKGFDKSDNFQDFKLPEDHSSVVHMPDGSTVPATHIRIKNYGSGIFHGYPVRIYN